MKTGRDRMDVDGFMGGGAESVPEPKEGDGWEVIFTETSPLFSVRVRAVNGRQAIQRALLALSEREGTQVARDVTEAVVRLHRKDGSIRWEATIPIYHVEAPSVDDVVEERAAPKESSLYTCRTEAPRSFGQVLATDPEDAAVMFFVRESLDSWWRGRYTEVSPTVEVTDQAGERFTVLVAEENVKGERGRHLQFEERMAPTLPEGVPHYTARLGSAFEETYASATPGEAAVNLVREFYTEILDLVTSTTKAVRVIVTMAGATEGEPVNVVLGVTRDDVAPQDQYGTHRDAMLAEEAAPPKPVVDAARKADAVATAAEAGPEIPPAPEPEPDQVGPEIPEAPEEDPEHGIGDPEPVADQGKTVLYFVAAKFGDEETKAHVEADVNEYHAAVALLVRFPSIPLAEVDRMTVRLVDPETGDAGEEADVFRQERLARTVARANELRNPGQANMVDPAISKAAKLVTDAAAAEFMAGKVNVVRAPRVERLVEPGTRETTENLIDAGGGHSDVKVTE